MAAIVPLPWTFVQLGPPSGTFTLAGPNAPYGRPRKSPVVEKERELRDSETYYSGNPVPTRHIFGDRQTPIVLSGRFMDSRIGTIGGAQSFYESLDAFVAAQVPVSIQWGGIYSGTGLLHKLRGAFESGEEIAWQLTIKIDTDDTQPIYGPPQAPVNVSDQMSQVLAKFSGINQNLKQLPPDITYDPGFLTNIAMLVSSINSYSAGLKKLANSVDNYESALASDVAKFQFGVFQYGTAIEQLQITLATGLNDAAIAKSRATAQAQWFQIRSQTNEILLEILAICAIMGLTAEIQLKGQPDTTYTACTGDTWESIAYSQLGSASRADDLKQANGIKYSAPPTPGMIIHIPKQ